MHRPSIYTRSENCKTTPDGRFSLRGSQLYKELRADTDCLVDALEKYKEYLELQSKRVGEAHGSATFVHEPEKDVTLHSFPASEAVQEACLQLQKLLDSKQPYATVFVNALAPADRYKRRHWFSKIQLNCPTMMYRYSHGNNLGTLSFVWKTLADTDQTQVARLVTKLTKSNPCMPPET